MRNRLHRHRPLFSNPLNAPKAPAPKMKWKVLPILWLAMKRTAMALGFVMLFSIFMSIFLMVLGGSGAGPDSVPSKNGILILEFDGGLAELPNQPSFADPFAPSKPTVRQVTEAIYAAKEDPRINGILARMQDGSFELAHVQEIRQAVKSFRESGKFAYIYSSSYGEAGGGLGRYYLASAFEELWMQPMGVVSIPGIHAEMPFARGLLDKLGVKPQFFKRHEYKTAYESFTDSQMSEPNREEIAALVADLRSILLADIAADRGMSEAQFGALVDQGLFMADDAVEAGLIDKADYADVLVDKVLMDVAGKPMDSYEDGEAFPMVGVQDYYADIESRLPKPGFAAGGKKKIALVYAVGAIMQAEEGTHGIANSAEIAPAILDAAADEQVGSIIVRIDSPGGSPVASESILRALERAKAKGKTVIVSMGPTAASGGYWIAANADRIFVLPSTITGSIGVLGGKVSLAGMMEKAGVNWQGVKWGENSGMWSPMSDFSAGEAQKVNMMLDHVYEAFVARVAKGRGKTVEEVHEVAQGRVWSGARAVELGLADEYGGMIEAIGYAMKIAGVEKRMDVVVEEFPKPKTPFEQFLEMFGGQVQAAAGALEMQGKVLGWLRPVFDEAEMMENPEAYQVYERLSVQ